ncbi:MAG: hypothetical protein HZB98_08400, partial [Bacteroidia bacterium]|nr:hypothetical protein [Bacteroidia bacterium]
MGRIWKRIVLLLSALALIAVTVLLLIYFLPEQPSTEMESARKALSVAAARKADVYSRKLYNQAKVLYDSAMVNWQKENRKFYYFRDYEKVISFANLSEEKALEAEANSISSSSSLKTNLQRKIESLNNLVTELDQLFDNYPLTEETRSRISRGKMQLEEAEIAFKKGTYLQANRKITDSEYLLTESFKSATENLKNYFESYSLWKKWVEMTVNESRRNNDYSIIIDKFSRKCYVYYGGRQKYEFDAELGKNWVGDKRVKGDMATPEGMYRITKKFDGRKTKYYKALLIDYPNEEDTARFRTEIEKGSLPPDAKIGGLIEIHGNGGK